MTSGKSELSGVRHLGALQEQSMNDVLKQAAEALRGLDEAYCRAGTELTREERAEDRQRLIAARAALAALESAQERQGWPVAVVDYSALGNIRWSFGPQAPDGTVLYATPQPLREMNADELRGLMPEPYRTTDRHISALITRNVLFEPGSYFTTDQLIAAMRAARSAK